MCSTLRAIIGHAGSGNWWSQRDLNPCLHLERVPSWAKLDDGTSLWVMLSRSMRRNGSTLPLPKHAVQFVPGMVTY